MLLYVRIMCDHPLKLKEVRCGRVVTILKDTYHFLRQEGCAWLAKGDLGDLVEGTRHHLRRTGMFRNV